MTAVIVPGWPKPIGYANGWLEGTLLNVGGQIGWTPDGKFLAKDLVGQFAQALDNVLAVVKAAGGEPTSVASMTIYVTNMDDYRNARNALGRIWRERFGTHYPAMALVAVSELFEREAVVEIQAVANLPSEPGRESGHEMKASVATPSEPGREAATK